jgi:Transposase DDE domain group 1
MAAREAAQRPCCCLDRRDRLCRCLPASAAVGARLFLRADEGFWRQDFLADLQRRQITYAIGAPLIASLRGRIGEIAESDWQPSGYREDSQVVSFHWRPTTWKRERRFIVRRDPAEHGEQLSIEGGEALLGDR